MAVGAVHSRHTALSNYSTIAAAQLMEFQLKYDSFRICFCPKESKWGLCFIGLRSQGVDSGEGLIRETYFPVYVLDLHHPICSPDHSLSKRNDLSETLYVQMHSAVRDWSRTKWGVLIKVFATRSQKWKNNYATCCAK